MSKVNDLLSRAFGSLAVTVLIAALISTSGQNVFGNPASQQDQSELAPCVTPNQVVCQNNHPVFPTDCNDETKGLRCDEKDPLCVCRHSRFKYGCICGYPYD